MHISLNWRNFFFSCCLLQLRPPILLVSLVFAIFSYSSLTDELFVFPRTQCACSRLNSLSHSVRVKSPNIIIIDISISISFVRDDQNSGIHNTHAWSTHICVFFFSTEKPIQFPFDTCLCCFVLLRVFFLSSHLYVLFLFFYSSSILMR